jgi:rhamnosyltransferase
VSPGKSDPQSIPPPRAGANPQVCAVMVTYNPDASFEENVRALLPQVGKLIIVDNRSAAAAHPLIAHAAASHDVEVIWNEQNLGIAGGLNKGIERALSSGQFSWIATFDQDSRAPADYIAAIFAAYSACPFRDQVALIGANHTEWIEDGGQGSGPSPKRFVFREIKTAMTSGSFVKTSTFGVCGRYDESLFMDYVDHEFCLRLRKHGLRVIQAGNAVLAHQLGSPTSHRFLGKRFRSSNHSASRRYHNAHNRLLVYGRYFSSEILWVFSDAFGWLRETVKVSLVERNRAEKLRCMAKGAWHAILELLGLRKKAPSGNGEKGRQ